MKKSFLNKGKSGIVLVCILCFLSSMTAFADNGKHDLTATIKQQEELLAKLNAKKAEQEQEAAKAQQETLVTTVKTVQDQQTEQKKTLDGLTASQQAMVGNISAIQQQMAQMQKVLEAIQAAQPQQSALNSITGKNEDVQNLSDSIDSLQQQINSIQNGRNAAVYVGPSAGGDNGSGNTQDAVNAQRDAEMSFAYANGGMYKIYCKVGYLTDIRFKPGEKITFVGGGNTAQWTLDTANTGSGETSVAHLYIKPNFKDVNTNLIVNTTNHSYQIVLNSSDWYNPIVSWTYTSEEQIAAKLGQAKDDVLFTERSLNLLSPEGLNFSYKIKKDDDCRWAPTMIFDDGMKTYIKMPSSIRQGNAPVLFIKEKGKKELSLVNYRIKDGYYIVDRLFSQAELRVSEKDYVRIVLDKD